MKKTYVGIIALFFLVSGTYAQNEVLFQKATDAYNEGEYQKAIGFYEDILENGKHSAELYFNLGNCHYKLDEIGPSIYYYEKALLLKPNDSEIKNNLGFAQNMRLDAVEEMPKTAMSRLHDTIVLSLSADQWAYLAIAMIFLFVLGFIIYYILYSATKKRIAFIVANTALFISFFSVAMGYLAHKSYMAKNPGIIFEREIVVTSEPNERSEKVFALHEGTKVNVLESLEDWHKIRIADGQTGWLPSNSLRLLKDF
ncbi:tetratricopeptide repeat protein [Flavobacteriaceae bacterium GF1]